jgi:hypothetical protein
MAYNGNDFMKASKLAHELKFEDFEVSDKHSENWFTLFLDADNGQWHIEPTYNGKFNICYEGSKVSVIGPDLELELKQFIEDKLSDQESDGKLSQDYIDTQNELWKNYGYGKN